MSPSACYSGVAACKTEGDLSAMVVGGGTGADGGKDIGGLNHRHPFGLTRKQSCSAEDANCALRVGKESHRIRKPPLPLPQVQYRPPIIIHTYSPKVIHTQPDDFMSLVQKLTGSSDTRLRLRKSPSSSSTKVKFKQGSSASTRTDIRTETSRPGRTTQGSGGSTSSMSNCGSPSSSEDSATLFVPHDPSSSACRGGGASEGAANSTVVVKQSNSPRSPLDSNFEFKAGSADSLLSVQFSGSAPEAVVSTGNSTSSSMFHPNHHVVKAEPMLSTFHDNPFFADFITSSTQHHHHLGSLLLQGAAPSRPGSNQMAQARPQPADHHHHHHHNQHNQHLQDLLMSNYGVDNVVPVSPGQQNLSAELIPQGWSQSNFLDYDGSLPGSHFTNQATSLRQRPFSNPSTSTMVALENIHAFMLT